MHDGYLFTLGVCGTASDASAAPSLLDAMLAALPPVKRAAFLGDVRLLDGDVTGDTADLSTDALLEPIAGDIVDAELLLVVTPVLFGELPSRLMALLQRITTLVSGNGLAGRLATIVFVADPSAETSAEQLASAALLAQFQRWCDGVGVIVDGALFVPDTTPSEHVLDQVTSLARDAYERASAALHARGISHAR